MSVQLTEAKDDPAKLARWIKDLPGGDKDTLLHRVAQGHGAQVQMELRHRFRGDPGPASGTCPRRTVAGLLDAAAATRHDRERRPEAARAALEARRARERELAREKRLDVLARNPEPIWARQVSPPRLLARNPILHPAHSAPCSRCWPDAGRRYRGGYDVCALGLDRFRSAGRAGGHVGQDPVLAQVGVLTSRPKRQVS